MSREYYIPSKLKVGFVSRNGTFDGKLSYVIYYDDKGVLRKEKSWDSWRDSSIEPIDITNEPTKGFVLNKGILRSSYYGNWHNMSRIYDPRGFEFEISVDNLHTIISHSDIYNSEIQQECVYSFRNNALWLIPVNSQDYKSSVSFTNKQSNKVSARDLIIGATYERRSDNSQYVYIGRYNFNELKRDYISNGTSKKYVSKGKKHIFWDGRYFVDISVSSFSHMVTDVKPDNFMELVYNYENSEQHLEIKRIFLDMEESILDKALSSLYRSVNESSTCFTSLKGNRYSTTGDGEVNLDGYAESFTIESLSNYYYQEVLVSGNSWNSVNIQVPGYRSNHNYWSYTYEYYRQYDKVDIDTFIEATKTKRIFNPMLDLYLEIGKVETNEQLVQKLREHGYGVLKIELSNGTIIYF